MCLDILQMPQRLGLADSQVITNSDIYITLIQTPKMAQSWSAHIMLHSINNAVCRSWWMLDIPVHNQPKGTDPIKPKTPS